MLKKYSKKRFFPDYSLRKQFQIQNWLSKSIYLFLAVTCPQMRKLIKLLNYQKINIFETYCCKCDCCVFLATVFGMFVAQTDWNYLYFLFLNKINAFQLSIMAMLFKPKLHI